ncbi:MAG: lipocalin family protein [bacterium]
MKLHTRYLRAWFLRCVVLWCALIVVAPFTLSQELRFPADDGKHEGVDFETWILFTELQASNGAHYRFAVFFASGKIVGVPVDAVYVFFADEKNREAEHSTKVAIPFIDKATHTEGKLFEQYGNAVLSRASASAPYAATFDLNDWRVTLTLTPKKSPVDLGTLVVGDRTTDRAYIVPRGEMAGKIEYEGKTYSLKGRGMFQHMWGGSPEENAAVDMFAIHLDDGTDVAAFYSDRIRGANRLLISTATDSVAVKETFSATADSFVTGGKTGVRFPVKWRLTSGDLALSLRLNPKLQGQEVEMLGLPYWVQTCEVEGSYGKKRVRGVAYVYLRNGGS